MAADMPDMAAVIMAAAASIPADMRAITRRVIPAHMRAITGRIITMTNITMTARLRLSRLPQATMPLLTACRGSVLTIRHREPISATTASGTLARNWIREFDLKGGAFELRRPLIYDRVASATPASVNTMAAIWPRPSGSCSAMAATITPITGIAMVPIAATEAGSRANAANQVT